MADTTINVNSGFYNAVNDDRTYYAEDMTRPYKRLVANGVFATPQGTPSTDLQVLPGGGMKVTVSPGEGIFANKWFENPSAISFDVPTVTVLGRARIDSVIVQIDNRTSGRVGSIVYRTGTAAANPVQPAINETANVIEYRLADVRVNITTSSNGISGTDITDYRGSANCPWVTALIQQPDTSAIFEQYRQAYAQLLEGMESGYEATIATEETRWRTFFDQVSTDLDVSMNLVTLRSSYETSGETTTAPIGIPTYDSTTDILHVYVNGLMAQEGVFWTANGSTITFTTAIGTGAEPDRVDVVVYKSVCNPNIGSIETDLDALNTRFDEELADTGWTASGIAYQNGSDYDDNHNKVMFRQIGKTAQLRGGVKGLTAAGVDIFTLPVSSLPTRPVLVTATVLRDMATIVGTAVIRISSDGYAYLQAMSGSVEATDMITIDATWFID